MIYGLDMKHKNHRHMRAGFTMIEVIVMVVIIGVLATVVGLRLAGRVGQAKGNVALTQIEVLRSAVNLFRSDGNNISSSDSLRDILWVKPSDDRGNTWRGPYIEKESACVDPWHNDYILRVPGEVHDGFDIISYGADGAAGGEGENADIIE